MANAVALLLVGTVAGAGLGALVTATVVDRPAMSKMASNTDMAHDHAAHDHGTTGHMHTMIEAGDPAPTLQIQIHPDGPQSRNLQIITTNFTFDPMSVNGENAPGRGHAHVYINDIKQPRSYAPWVHLDALPKGQHHIRVTLNANDHSQLAVEGVPIEAVLNLTID